MTITVARIPACPPDSNTGSALDVVEIAASTGLQLQAPARPQVRNRETAR
jgi:hypothetical protein